MHIHLAAVWRNSRENKCPIVLPIVSHCTHRIDYWLSSIQTYKHNSCHCRDRERQGETGRERETPQSWESGNGQPALFTRQAATPSHPGHFPHLLQATSDEPPPGASRRRTSQSGCTTQAHPLSQPPLLCTLCSIPPTWCSASPFASLSANLSTFRPATWLPINLSLPTHHAASSLSLLLVTSFLSFVSCLLSLELDPTLDTDTQISHTIPSRPTSYRIPPMCIPYAIPNTQYQITKTHYPSLSYTYYSLPSNTSLLAFTVCHR